MNKLIAVKSMRYATRRLLPDDEFMASARDTRLLTAIGKARLAADSKPTAGISEEDEIKALRESYQDAFGKRPFMGWDADTLREKIDAA